MFDNYVDAKTQKRATWASALIAVYEAASFYGMYNLQPVGRHNVTVAEIVAAVRPVAFLLWAAPDETLIAKLDAADSGWIRLHDAAGRNAFDRGQAVVFVPR